MSGLGRPKPSDGEDDLVRMMEELKSGQISINPDNIIRAGEKRNSNQATYENGINITCDDRTSDHVRVIIHDDIIERIIDNVDESTSLPPKAVPAQAKLLQVYGKNTPAFPATFVVDSEGTGTGRAKPKKGHSLFARKMTGKSGSKKETPESEYPTILDSCEWGQTSRTLPAASSGVLSDVEKENIHRENIRKLRAMTVDEITAARNAFLCSMSTESIKFLKAKVNESSPSTVPGQDTAAEAEPFNKDDEVEKDISTIESTVPYLNMERVEEDKMEWMMDMPQMHLDIGKNADVKYIARFDFEGFLIPFDADIPVHEGLHHHGDEPNRAGYSLDELLMLCRSTNIQQKVIAFNTICKIILQYKRGYFDAAHLDQNIIDKLREHDFVLILRTSLDDAVELIRESALSCLRQLLDNQYDELMLDKEYSSWFGHIQPSLPSDIMKNEEKMEEFDNSRYIRGILMG